MTPDNANIAHQILRHWDESQECQAIFEGLCDAQLTRKVFLKLAAHRQKKLKARVNAGDAVMIASNRGPFFFVDLFATWGLGAVAVPYAGDDPEERVEMLRDISEAKVKLDAKPWKDVESAIDSSKSISGKPVTLECNAKDLAAVLFTSGSTGVPKGVMLSHEVLAGNAQSMLKRVPMESDRLFVNIPFHFTSCICHFLACCFSGSTMLGTERKLLLSELYESISKSKATSLGGAPVQLRWLAEIALQNRLANLTLKFVVSSGDHLSVDVIADLLKCWPDLKIFTVYGLTELGGRFCVLDPNDLNEHMGSVGRPIDGLKAQVLHSDNKTELPSGEEGEIYASGNLIASGYLHNPEATKRAFTANGLRTGDIGWVDADGFLFVSGRSDDVFKVNGKKVSAVPIARELMATGVFSDVAVVPQELPVFGTVPMAFGVLRAGHQFHKGSILRELRKELPPNHIPYGFHIIKAIPRTGSGKVNRNALHALTMGPAET